MLVAYLSHEDHSLHLPFRHHPLNDSSHSLPTLFLLGTCLEALAAGLCTSRLVLGSLAQTGQPRLWIASALGVFALYLALSLWPALRFSNESAVKSHSFQLLAFSSAPFLVAFLVELLMLRFRPDLGARVEILFSPIQPYPVLAVGAGLLAIFLAKVAFWCSESPRQSPRRAAILGRSADLGIPAAFLLLGVLQASVYLMPIGNAFLRFWAIADGHQLLGGYPVTLTEPGPVSAGSPPFVYDLPLFPAMLKAAFALLGHNSAAAHLPAAMWNTFFPLSLYLLIRESTKSRAAAVVFASLTSLFPYLRFWVLNLPDPDPFLLTSLNLAAYLYLRAVSRGKTLTPWLVAGLAAGILALGRPEGILYAACLAVGVLACRPTIKQLLAYLGALGLFVAPMVCLWELNFGFLWPQNYNHTLALRNPERNYSLLKGYDALGFYHRGLGVDAQGGILLVALFVLCVLGGTAAMALHRRRLLAFAIPAIGNTVLIFFADPYIPNTYHFADFFRHASFGIPLLMVVSAYGCYRLYSYLACRRRLNLIAYIGLLLLVAATLRESDILANPTATHRPGAEQVLTTYTYLSMQSILAHPMTLPTMTYYLDGTVTVARPTFMVWPDDALTFFKPLDMSFDSNGRPFGYASGFVFLVALGFALLADRGDRKLGESADTLIAMERAD